MAVAAALIEVGLDFEAAEVKTETSLALASAPLIGLVLVLTRCNVGTWP